MIATSIVPVLRRYGLTMVLCWAIAMNGFGGGGDMAFEEIAPNVFVHLGPHVEATPANQGATANVAFIIGSRCVAVIDTGGSFAEGTAMHAAIRKRTALPICFVVNTHVHPDHVFGNAAFATFGLIVKDETVLSFFCLIFGGEEEHVIFLFANLLFEIGIHFGKLAVGKFPFWNSLAPDPTYLQFHLF